MEKFAKLLNPGFPPNEPLFQANLQLLKLMEKWDSAETGIRSKLGKAGNAASGVVSSTPTRDEP